MPSGVLLVAGAPGKAVRTPDKAALTPQISVKVNLVAVPVTVTDARGEFVSKLSREDFRLLVDGNEQPIEYFTPEEDPTQVLILLETGPAVYLLRREHITAATALLAGLGTDDRVAVASYSDQPQLLLNFTADKREAAASLNSAGYELGMSNLNFYASLASALDWLAAGDGKRAIVALTTGLDSSGPGPWQHLLERMQQSNVLVLPVALGGELRDTKARAKKPSDASAPIGEEMSFAESKRALEAIAEETGGHAFFPRNARDFQANAYKTDRLAAAAPVQLGLHGSWWPTDATTRSAWSIAGNGGKAGGIYRINSRRGFLAPSQ